MPDRLHCSEPRNAHQAVDLRTFDLLLVASRVYAVLCARLPLDVNTAVSQTEISQLARLSRRHVGFALDDLADASLITRATPAPGLPQLVTLLPLDALHRQPQPDNLVHLRPLCLHAAPNPLRRGRARRRLPLRH